MKLEQIIFWHVLVCQLQVPYIRELAKEFNGDVILVVPEELTKERLQLGWIVPDCAPAKLLVNPDKSEIEKIIKDNPESTYHIFNGIRDFSFVWSAFRKSLKVKTNRAIISEGRPWYDLKGPLRLLRGRYDALRYGKFINRIFAMGSLGVQWFRMCGFPENKIVKFAYFTERPQSDAVFEPVNSPFKILFIGQCVKRKGIDILLSALSGLKNLDWHLEIIGDGRDRTEFQEQAVKLGIGDRVNFIGVLLNPKAMYRLQFADLLVLPSRWDGWGAVVNEALMRGVPVLCSSRCGASDLVRNSFRGDVFQSGSVVDLRNKLRGRIAQGKPSKVLRKAIQQWATRIYGDSGARYFKKIIIGPQEGLKPASPWE